jgi:thiol-disulfide isomerase/thioredoxin
MRLVLPTFALAAVFAVGCGGTAPTKPNTAGGKSTLAVGDPAPPLSVTKWMHGDPVEQLKPGKVYVLEFWATWCGPCIEVMPHLSKLQADNAHRGLVVIGVTSRDQKGNNLQSVTSFVNKKGGIDLNYRVAYCDDDKTERAYMQAAGQDGIPCSFVIGRDGKVAFIGHPKELDKVLPGLLDAK